MGMKTRIGRLEELSLVRRAERLRAWLERRYSVPFDLETAVGLLKMAGRPFEGDVREYARRLAAEDGSDPEEFWREAEELAVDPEFLELIR